MRIVSRLFFLAFAVVPLLAFAACGDDDGVGLDTDYPSAGEDRFERTVATVEIEVTLPGVSALPVVLGGLETVQMEGPMLVLRGDPQDADSDGLVDIQTEIVEMSLTGTSSFGPLEVRQSPDQRSMGMVEQQQPGQDFPADSFFDVFLEVEILDVSLVGYNPEPIRMEAELSDLPPGFRDQYEGALALPTPLLSADSDVEFARILDALHVPNPPPEDGEPPEEGETPEVTATAVPTEEPTEEPPPAGGLSGTRNCTIDIVLDLAGHGPFGNFPPTIDLDFQQPDHQVVIDGPAPWVRVEGSLLDGGEIMTTGMGEFAGFPDIDFRFDGFFDGTQVSGNLGVGEGGGLPQNEPIIYQVTCP